MPCHPNSLTGSARLQTVAGGNAGYKSFGQEVLAYKQWLVRKHDTNDIITNFHHKGSARLRANNG
eukprot:1065054-Pelagomonas_calceolata.AAC.3